SISVLTLIGRSRSASSTASRAGSASTLNRSATASIVSGSRCVCFMRAFLDRQVRGGPAGDAAGQDGDVGEPELLQQRGGNRRTAAGLTLHDDRPPRRNLGGAVGQV